MSQCGRLSWETNLNQKIKLTSIINFHSVRALIMSAYRCTEPYTERSKQIQGTDYNHLIQDMIETLIRETIYTCIIHGMIVTSEKKAHDDIM